MAFGGYLLKGAGGNNVNFPLKYIAIESWKSTPNNREEIKAYRDENTRDLTRITATGHKSSFSFTTREGLHLTDKQWIQNFFVSNESDHNQRKVRLTYWNDESNSYQTSDFYRPNMEFQLKQIKGNDIIYMPMTFELIEY